MKSSYDLGTRELFSHYFFNEQSKMTWLTDIIRGLRSLGGEASLPELYGWIERNRQMQLPPNFKSAIRAMLQSYCGSSSQYKPQNPSLFANPSRGWWALRSISNPNSVKLNEMDLIVLAMQSISESQLKVLQSEGDLVDALKLKARSLLLG